MKGMHRHALTAAVALAALAAGGAPSVVAAQGRNAPPPDAPRILVPTLNSSDKGLGVQAADAIRSRLNQDFPFKVLWVIPKSDINGTLEASGFRTDTALGINNARDLAKLLRADEILVGTVTKTDQGFTITPTLVLARDPSLAQPMPPVTGERMDLAAMLLSRELADARKQLTGDEQCEDALRNKNAQAAITAAKQAIASYPQATIARLCLATAYQQANMPDSVIAASNEVLKTDSLNKMALQMLAEAYKSSGKSDLAMETWTKLLTADPGNVRVQEEVVRELAASGNPAVAMPVIDSAVAHNPFDASLMKLQYLIHLAAHDWKGSIRIAGDLAKADTAAVDTLYFTRLVAAYAADSQPQQAAEAAARAVAKFPNNASLWALRAQLLRNSGQLQQALDATKRALAINPKIMHGWVQLAQAEVDLNQPDSALAALHQAIPNGEDTTFAAQYALKIGNDLYKAAVAAKSRFDSTLKSASAQVKADSAAANRAAFMNAERVLAYSDSIAPSASAGFLLGVSAFYVGQSAATEAPKTKSCELAKQAQDQFLTSQMQIMKNGQASPDAAKQVLGALQQYSPVVDNQVKVFCKS